MAFVALHRPGLGSAGSGRVASGLYAPLHASALDATTIAVKTAFELFDHTADIGIRATAPSLPGLIPPAGKALYSIIGELVPSDDKRAESWELVDDDSVFLLRDYLAELLHLFESEMRIVIEPVASVFEDGRLVVHAQSVAINQRHSDFLREIKAVTYHELEIAEVDGGYQATIIVDI